ncbi:MAG: Rrf2 family transcriptional regulator [Bacteroidales bacterium]|nr:Rrf2 family transcriptional regulator [Bacteroidales bacterium]
MSKVIAISEAAGIGFHSMALIARSEKPINATQIAEYTKSSRHHVAKVMQRLVKSGLINSSRGPAGGFWLNKASEEINLLEIYEAIEGKFEPNSCPLDYHKCVMGTCILEQIASSIGKVFKEYLETTSLGDVNKLKFKPLL